MNSIIKTFKGHNPNIKIDTTDGKYNLSALWGVQNMNFSFSSEEFKKLKGIEFPSRYAAMYHHTRTEKYEFFFTLEKKSEEPLLQRKIIFNYKQLCFKAYYAQATPTFDMIASKFADNEINVYDSRNLHRFRYYYIKDTLPAEIKESLADLLPINFFVEGPFNKISYDEHLRLFKHINFYMTYYDRHTPQIMIYDIPTIDTSSIKQPCLTENYDFPSEIEAIEIDDSIIDLFEAARETPSIRLKYIFYFQVLEFCAFYHLKENLKNSLSNILRNPDIISKREYYAQRIVDELKESFKQNDDSAKIESVICVYCKSEDIENEIQSNIDYFTAKIEFDGGFCIDPLFDKKAVSKDAIDVNLKIVKNNIEKIRNVLVHARESRETKVIKQTSDNMEKIKPYLYLLRRIAEVVAYRMNPII